MMNKIHDKLEHLEKLILRISIVDENKDEILNIQEEWLERLEVNSSIEEYFVRTRAVVAGTASGFVSLSGIANLDFDLCIIDEASKATPNTLMIPISKSKRTVLIGDSAQLPPMNTYAELQSRLIGAMVSEAEYNETLFEYLERTLPSDHVVRLSTQYRMVPGIGELISKCFYDSKLISLTPAYPHFLKRYSAVPICWLDTSKLDSQRHQMSSESSLYNPDEALTVAAALERLDSALDEESSPVALSVMVITPYRGQVRTINNLLRHRRFRNISALEVLTVDEAQGREADAVFLSLVRSNPRGGVGFLSDPRRVNVAFSRARKSLTIIGNFEFYRDAPTRIAEIVEYIESNPEQAVRISEVTHA